MPETVAPSVHYVDIMASVTVTVNDPTVITRVLENWDDQGNPQPRTKSGRGWKDLLYDLADEDEVLYMLAYNYVANGVEDISRLDGWGDCKPGAVTFESDYQRW